MLRLGVKRLTTEPPGAFRTARQSRGLRSLSFSGGVKAFGRGICLGLCEVANHPPALSFFHGNPVSLGVALDVQASCARLYPCPYWGAGNEKPGCAGQPGSPMARASDCQKSATDQHPLRIAGWGAVAVIASRDRMSRCNRRCSFAP